MTRTPLNRIPILVWSWLPCLIFVALMLGVAWGLAQQTGRVVYPLDDTYIHMAIARHLAEHGVYGASLSGFSATSSSPAWTFLLALFGLILGPQEWLPFALNLSAGVALLWVLTRELRRWMVSPWVAALTAMGVAALLPLPALTALGMEHTLHILVVILFVHSAIRRLNDEASHKNAPLLLLAFIAVGLRYESVFVAAPLAVLFLLRGRWGETMQIALGAATPVLLVGFWQLSQGWYFFPSAIALKSVLQTEGVDRLHQAIARLQGQLFSTPHITLPFLMAAFAYFRGIRNSGYLFSEAGARQFVFLCACALHCSMASTGWYHRYEAYLLALAVWALIPLAEEAREWRRRIFTPQRLFSERVVAVAAIAAAFLTLAIIYKDNVASITTIHPRGVNIYQQQYQLGLFVKRYYQGETVAANDIGAINFLADIYCLDLVGLGSIEPALARDHGRWNPGFLDSWARQHNARVAILYESWWENVIPESWIKVGEWTLERRIAAADATVSFFALDRHGAALLRERLLAFESKLPDGVKSLVATLGESQ